MLSIGKTKKSKRQKNLFRKVIIKAVNLTYQCIKWYNNTMEKRRKEGVEKMIQFDLTDLPPNIRKQAEEKLAPKKSKFSSVKTIIDGHAFDSKKEAKYYSELKIREKAGEIKELKLQPRFLLQNGFSYNGKRYRKIEYIADFEYFDVMENKHVVVDVKGYKTDVYQIKKKLFLNEYGDDVLFIEA